MHAYIHTCIHTYIHTCIHAYIAYMYACMHACMHAFFVLTYIMQLRDVPEFVLQSEQTMLKLLIQGPVKWL